MREAIAFSDRYRAYARHTDKRCGRPPEIACYCGLDEVERTYFKFRPGALNAQTDLIREIVDLLRCYRSRTHRVCESEDGGISPWHTVYGVHTDLAADTDAAIQQAKDMGWCSMIVREYL